MSRYEYTPLDAQSQQIRLLSLAPGMFDDDIYISLEIVALTRDNPPEYEGVSYTWGSTKSRPDVVVMPHVAASNLELSRRLAVTQNLAQALRYLRSPVQPRTLWIDAICINQDDKQEREQQVERMGDVYRSARQVLVWLGPTRNDSALAMETLNSLGRRIVVDWAAERMRPKALVDAGWTNLNILLPYDDNTWRSINDFLRRSWFTRLWVWQEVLLAPKAEMHCGFDSIGWHTFGQAIFCLTGRSEDLKVWARLGFPDLYNCITSIFQLLQLSSSSFHIFWLLESFENRECLDPRDRINALLHLLSPSERAVMPKPNYTQSPYRIFQEVILNFLKHRGQLDLLSFCEWDGESPIKPSWVPDWSRPRNVTSLLGVSASWGSQAKAWYMGEGLLKVTGRRTAEIGVIKSSILQNDEDPWCDPTPIQAAQWIREVSKGLDIHLPYITGGRTIDAFSRTIFRDYFVETLVPAGDNMPSVNDVSQYVRDVLRGPFEEIGCDSLLLRHLYYAMERRWLSVSKEGHICLVPAVAMKGDIVCVILGCKSPLLLRPLPNGNYTVVGECYIHGLMYGEALLGTLTDGWKSVTILEEGQGYRYGFHNVETGERSFVDPRLGSLPPGWSLKDSRLRADWGNWFVNNQTGERMEWPQDPRVTAEALEVRGVPLQEFILE